MLVTPNRFHLSSPRRWPPQTDFIGARQDVGHPKQISFELAKTLVTPNGFHLSSPRCWSPQTDFICARQDVGHAKRISFELAKMLATPNGFHLSSPRRWSPQTDFIGAGQGLSPTGGVGEAKILCQTAIIHHQVFTDAASTSTICLLTPCCLSRAQCAPFAEGFARALQGERHKALFSATATVQNRGIAEKC